MSGSAHPSSRPPWESGRALPQPGSLCPGVFPVRPGRRLFLVTPVCVQPASLKSEGRQSGAGCGGGERPSPPTRQLPSQVTPECSVPAPSLRVLRHKEPASLLSATPRSGDLLESLVENLGGCESRSEVGTGLPMAPSRRKRGELIPGKVGQSLRWLAFRRGLR